MRALFGVATRAIAGEVNCAIGTAAKWRVRYAKGLPKCPSEKKLNRMNRL